MYIKYFRRIHAIQMVASRMIRNLLRFDVNSLNLCACLLVTILLGVFSPAQAEERELPVVSIKSLVPSVIEGSEALFLVSLDAPVDDLLAIGIKFGGSAYEGDPEELVSLSLLFFPGQLEQLIPVLTSDDTVGSGDREITASLVTEDISQKFKFDHLAMDAIIVVEDND